MRVLLRCADLSQAVAWGPQFIMPVPPSKPLHPVAQRTLSNVAQCLTNGTASFYLGSGIDQQLAIDAGNSSTKSTWNNLLIQLEPFAPAKPSEIEKYASEWPTETAMAARMRLGEDKFKSRIATCADISLDPNLKKPFTRAMGPLLLKTNLIVTPNYSSHILRLLRTAIAKANSRQEIIVVSREDLASFEFPSPESKPDRIFLVYIHGRCVGTGNVVLDAWGYNVAVNDDPHYHRFLYDLFSRRTVVCIGTSLQDIPLRNQAAFVFRTRTYQRPSHVSLMYSHHYDQTPQLYKNELRSDSHRRKWANAMHAGYGIRVVPLDQLSLTATVSNLSQPNSRLTRRPRPDDLANVAAFFDSCGDYESQIVQEWLLEAQPRGARNARQPNEHIRFMVKRLYRRLLSAIQQNAMWEVVARLESHLRHFHYLYTHRFEPNDRSNTQLWEQLAAKLTKRIWNRLDDSIKFRFLIGQYELAPFGVKKPPPIETYRTGDQLYDKRLKLGEKIWPDKDKPLSNAVMKQTALRLLDLGWESMASKLFLDAAINMARDAPDYPDRKTSKAIIELARRGGEIARATGYFRREAKAETVTAMWFEDPEESRIRILSKLRAAETNPTASTNKRLERRTVIEPALVAGLTAALLASHIRSLHLSGANDLDFELGKTVSPLLEEAGVDWHTVPRPFLDYWDKLIEPRAGSQRAFSKALRGHYIKKQ